MMNNLSEDELQYLAGFFDGEGSVGLYFGKKTRRWRTSIEITQNYSRWADKLMRRWAAYFGGSVRITKEQTVRWFMRGEAERKFIKEVSRYTRLKTRQLIVLEQYIETRAFPFRAAQLLKTLKRST